MFLFSVPKNKILLQVLYSPETGAIVQEQSAASIAILAEATDTQKVAQIYKSAQAYSVAWLKQLALRVYDALQEDEELTVNDVIFDAMDIIDMEIAAEQADIDADAVDDQELYSYEAAQPNR